MTFLYIGIGFTVGFLTERFLRKWKLRRKVYLDSMDFEKKAKLRENIQGGK